MSVFCVRRFFLLCFFCLLFDIVLSNFSGIGNPGNLYSSIGSVNKQHRNSFCRNFGAGMLLMNYPMQWYNLVEALRFDRTGNAIGNWNDKIKSYMCVAMTGEDS